MTWKAAFAVMAMLLLAPSVAEARRFDVRGEHIALIRPGHPPATIVSPQTGEVLYRIPRRFLVGGRTGRRLVRSLMLHPLGWRPPAARPIPVQYSGYGPAVMQPPDVVRELGRQGYRDVGGLTRRGSNYVGEATGPQGQRQRLIIDPQSGRVRGSSPSGGGRGPSGGGFYGGY